MICYRHVLQLLCKHDRVVEPESIKRYCFFIYSLIELFVCFNSLFYLLARVALNVRYVCFHVMFSVCKDKKIKANKKSLTLYYIILQVLGF